MKNKRISGIISEAIERELRKFTNEGVETYNILSNFVADYNESHPNETGPSTYEMGFLSVNDTGSFYTFGVSLHTNGAWYAYNFDITTCYVRIRKRAVLRDRYDKSSPKFTFGNEYYDSEHYDVQSVCSHLIEEWEGLRKKEKSAPEPMSEDELRNSDAKYNKLCSMVYIVIRAAAGQHPEIQNVKEFLGQLKCEICTVDAKGKQKVNTVLFYYDRSGRLDVYFRTDSYHFDWNKLMEGNTYQFFVELFRELIDMV